MKLYELDSSDTYFTMVFHEWAIEAHKKSGCTYSGYDYKLHLDAVRNVARQYLHLIKPEFRIPVLLSASAHDLIEDTNVSYNDIIKQSYGEDEHESVKTADIVYNVTNELGRNRKERSEKTYPKIASCTVSTFIKLCDRISNGKFSHYINDEQGMFQLYKKEHSSFSEALYNSDHGFDEMWRELDKLFS